ncbi:MAG TPA: serine/threonine-protein kinase [Polyangiaceae bacterium]|jgi:serine/threonine-protein kinase
MHDPSAPPLRLGNYEPLLELASGGMATVYVARQIGAAGFERIVVVKRVHRHLLGNREFYDMFRDEARVASMVRHPNVVPVIDVVEVHSPERELFLVMEYVESSSVSTLRKAAHEAVARVPVPIVARVLYDTLMGLHAAHTAIDIQGRPLGVVHRDVSPQNIIVGVDGSSRLIDFGVAKASHRLTETKSGSVKGKYSYMAPEQAKGLEVDRRTDIFAAGVVLHECLTDRRLFRGENELDTVRRIMEGEIPAPSTFQPALPAALDAVTLKALARAPAERFQTATEMAEAIESAVSLASHREVAAYLEKVCGPRLAERREALREMLSGQVPPLAVELMKDAGDSQSSRSMRFVGEEPTRHEGSGTDSRIAVESPPARENKSRIPLVAGIAAGVAALVAIIVAMSMHAAPTPMATATPTVTATATATVTVTAPATMSAPIATAITVDLTADGPIESVDVPGSKKIELAGDVAHVTLDPWKDPIDVRATLKGGKKAIGKLAPGATALALVTERPKAPTGGHVTTKPPDLQGNPYGAP